MKNYCLGLMLFVVPLPVLADNSPATELRPHRGVLRLSYDPVMLPGNEAMGLAGVGYLFDIGPSAYAGIGGYGAVAGQRGGFFTGGVEAGWRRQLTARWLVDAGLFLGAGGGGAAPQGGGLMVRPHAGLLYDLGRYRLGLGYSWVKYPNGSIDSRQWSLMFERPFTLYLAAPVDGGSGATTNVPAGIRLAPVEITLPSRQYSPVGDSRATDGSPLTASSNLVGISLRHYRGNHRFDFVEAAGSAGGVTDGYAEILAGVGYGYTLPIPKTALEATLSLGAGGGGRVDTGGGLIVRSELAAVYQITPAFLARFGAGYMVAPEGHYQARTLTAQLGYRWQMAGAYRYGHEVEADEPLDTMNWRIRAVNQVYTVPAWKGAPRGDRINLLGLKIDAMLTSRTYLTGHALVAYDGGAGGYAAGLVGVGAIAGYADRKGLNATIELAVGAAGGGSIDVGSGLIAQPGIGVSYRANRHLSLDLGYGRIKALAGALDSPVYELGITYRFATSGKRF